MIVGADTRVHWTSFQQKKIKQWNRSNRIHNQNTLSKCRAMGSWDWLIKGNGKEEELPFTIRQ
ncbi:MAG: hypothetical protein EA409_01200 [Saprospirales bacterium]|nr:MAG: hypothetical protein EA409_01200 [Saprospirales bacterium]